jgi:peptidoglycan/xylan/chitin deacetylase (PgdA/CDA1 family)
VNLSNVWARARGRYQRTASRLLFRRLLEMHSTVPCISFTFDDFPRSALHAGGGILEHVGLRATYYASLGLMGTEAATGALFEHADLERLLAVGHELGCHTFTHCHSWETSPVRFEESVIRNQEALEALFPGMAFRSHAYPISYPRPGTKRRMGRRFASSRSGGQGFNVGSADVNLLKAYFLEKCRDNTGPVKEAIDLNRAAGGWLILATHDISKTPTPFGCTPAFFGEIVEYSLASGARILPVSDALDAIRADCRVAGEPHLHELNR